MNYSEIPIYMLGSVLIGGLYYGWYHSEFNCFRNNVGEGTAETNSDADAKDKSEERRKFIMANLVFKKGEKPKEIGKEHLEKLPSKKEGLSVRSESIGDECIYKYDEEECTYSVDHDNTTAKQLSSWRSSSANGAPPSPKSIMDFSTSSHCRNICAICLDDLRDEDDVCYSKNKVCHHKYHLNCMIEWLMKGHDDCPQCREDYLLSGIVEENNSISL
mmetsp:Transcript_9238/g.13824  ORF Transcript_9238/g.13824 Transcript_9238/m.13824 type:complete len:217 (-) Transcript_9238:66-716(-)